jgi:hypothetical protein
MKTRIKQVENAMVDGREMNIQLPLHVYQRMLSFARVSEGEISGFARTKLIFKKDLTQVTVLDAQIFKQKVNSVHTTLHGDDLTAWYLHLVKEKQNPAEWNLWWHSHGTMTAFFSGEDEATIAKLSKSSKLYSICINAKGDMVGRIDKNGKLVSELKIEVESLISNSMLQACKLEVQQKVTYEAFAPAVHYRTPRGYPHGEEGPVEFRGGQYRRVPRYGEFMNQRELEAYLSEMDGDNL